MSLSKKEFLVLREVARDDQRLTQREIARRCGISIGSVNAALRSCEEFCLVEKGRVTPEGRAALEPYRVDNAVIMAAGLSSRFAPISYEKPKGVLRVRGEVLVERQVRQLHEAGIDDVTVVVGYKKEYFFYLAEKLGVRIVVNPEYAARNNNSSLMAVRGRLGSTYVCSSDDYFSVNPFNRYEYSAYYACVHVDGPTDEWCVTCGAHDVISSVAVGGRDADVMLGHVYFDRDFSARFSRILQDEYDRPETAGKLWESIYLDHVDELPMRAQVYPDGVIHEFDSLDELRDFDPHFIENVDSSALGNITRVLGCERDQIADFYPLKQGLTNLSCHFSANGREYVYRHPGVGTDKLVDRRAESAALHVAQRLGLDSTYVYQDPDQGWKISRFVPDCHPLDAHDPQQLARAMRMARELHEQDVTVDRTFDFYEQGRGYERSLREHGPIEIGGYDELADQARRVSELVHADHAPVCLCHNDFFSLNFLVDEKDRCSLIDWEYAGMSDYANDFGTFCVCCELSDDEVEQALEDYFGRRPTDAELRHNLAHVGLAGWCWYVWALLKEAEGDAVDEWLYIYYSYATRYLGRALSLYERAGAEVAR